MHVTTFHLRFSSLRTEAAKSRRFNLLMVFAVPDQPVSDGHLGFRLQRRHSRTGRRAGPYPWQSGQSVPAGENSVAYAVGKGRIIELPGPVIDPETFAQDIRRLLDQDKDKELASASGML